MIVVLKPSAPQESREQLVGWLKALGLEIHVSEGQNYTVLGLVGDTSKVDMDLVASLDIVDSVKRVSEPFKCCNRKFHPEDTVVQVGDVKIGRQTAMGKVPYRILKEAQKEHIPVIVLAGSIENLPEFPTTPASFF